MKKKLALLLVGTLMAISLVACGGKTETVVEEEPIATEEANVETETEDATVAEESTEVVEESIVEETETETEAADGDTVIVETGDVEYTEEQTAFINELATLIDTYNEAVDLVNSNAEWSGNEAVVASLNAVTDAMDAISVLCEDPANLTAEAMAELRMSFEDVYLLIDEINLSVK